MKIIQLGYFREQRAKVRACTRPWRLPRKQKETRKACFIFASDEILFFLAACLAEHFLPEAVFLCRLL